MLQGMSIGRALKRIRQRKKLDQTKVAEHLKVDRSVVSRMERGAVGISAERLQSWAAFLGVPVGRVLRDSGTEAAG